MATFRKISDSVSSVIGTKLKNNLLVVSSGIPSLDYVIGGGLPTGGIFVVESDVLGSYSRVLTKYFLAEGVVCKHDLLLFSADENPEEIVMELPQPCVVQKDDNLTKEPQNEMKIAWRYEGLKKVESSFDNEFNFGHHFDLSRYIDADTIKEINITYCYLNQEENCGRNAFKNDIYNTVLSKIKNLLAKDQYKKSSKNKNILRISINLLGSPIWLAMDCNEEPLDNNYGHDLIKFMYCLRILLRDTNAVAFITMPSHLFDDDQIMNRLLYSIDNAVRIESFAGSDKETNPVFNEYHGLFHLTKLSALYSLVPYVPSCLDLAFKLKRKKFLIEKLHLPPELQESSEREQDDITAVPRGCGGFRKKDIEF